MINHQKAMDHFFPSPKFAVPEKRRRPHLFRNVLFARSGRIHLRRKCSRTHHEGTTKKKQEMNTTGGGTASKAKRNEGSEPGVSEVYQK